MDGEIFFVHASVMARPEKRPSKAKHFLRKWRQHRGYTLEAAGAEIGISHATLGRIERGLLPYSEPILTGLAWLYKCTPADLLSRDPAKAEVA